MGDLAEPMTMTSGNEQQRFLEGMRVLIVGGIAAGAVLIGAGSRLAMLVLRMTSPRRVHGIVSDDGFIIGQVTLAGTYNLLLLGSSLGIIGAAAYRMVSPWLIGPWWFRRVTTGLAAAAVVGSMLVHTGGVDFTLLQPTWLAIGLFVALPGMFGTLIGPVVDAVGRPDTWTAKGRSKWFLPLVSVAIFPLSFPVILVAAFVFRVWVAASDLEIVRRVRTARLYALAVRSMWLGIALIGLVALVHDTRSLTS